MIDLSNKKIARYARVSTDDKGQSTENQFMRMDLYCMHHGIKDFIDYSDEESGGSLDRPGWNKLVSELDEEKRDGILVTYADRYSRNLVEALSSIEELLKNGRFIIFSESSMILDQYPLPEDIWSFLSFQFMQAEYYRRHLSSNTKAGIARVVKEIKKTGSHVSRSGRTIERVGRPATVIVKIEDVLALRDAGLSLRQIAEKLGSKKSTIHNILKREFGTQV